MYENGMSSNPRKTYSIPVINRLFTLLKMMAAVGHTIPAAVAVAVRLSIGTIIGVASTLANGDTNETSWNEPMTIGSVTTHMAAEARNANTSIFGTRVSSAARS